jgi:hypothetical protein
LGSLLSLPHAAAAEVPAAVVEAAAEVVVTSSGLQMLCWVAREVIFAPSRKVLEPTMLSPCGIPWGVKRTLCCSGERG